MRKILIAILCIFLLGNLPLNAQDHNRKDSKGRRQGLWMDYYPNGQKRYEGKFKDDKCQGTFTYYDEKGILKATNTFDKSGTKALNKTYSPDNYMYGGFTLLDTIIARHPQLNFILGMHTYEIFTEKPDMVCKKMENGLYVSEHNTSTCYNKYGVTDLYHKSRLVPGVEKMPFPKLLFFMEDMVIDMGGPSVSLSPDTAQHALSTTINNGTLKVGTAICYESAFG